MNKIEVDFAVDAGGRTGTATANVIGNPAATRHLTETVEVRDSRAQPDPAQDVLPLALVERDHGTGRVVNAFVQGFGLDAACGVATTVAHDLGLVDVSRFTHVPVIQ